MPASNYIVVGSNNNTPRRVAALAARAETPRSRGPWNTAPNRPHNNLGLNVNEVRAVAEDLKNLQKTLPASPAKTFIQRAASQTRKAKSWLHKHLLGTRGQVEGSGRRTWLGRAINRVTRPRYGSVNSHPVGGIGSWFKKRAANTHAAVLGPKTARKPLGKMKNWVSGLFSRKAKLSPAENAEEVEKEYKRETAKLARINRAFARTTEAPVTAAQLGKARNIVARHYGQGMLKTIYTPKDMMKWARLAANITRFKRGQRPPPIRIPRIRENNM